MDNLNDRTNVRTELDDGVAIVTMNRAEKRNALSLAMMRELTQAFVKLSADPATRAFILRGEGPAFSAGHDLRELQCADADAAREIFDACVVLMETIQSIPQPVIAEVATIATAAGCQLVATCDLAIAATEATFATPGVRIGLFCTTPMVALTRAIGRKRAMEMLLTGDPIDAATAADWGLINRVVPASDLHDTAMTLARRIAQSASTTIERGKQAFYRQIDLDQAGAYRYAKGVMTANALAEDAREGIAAFVEKRPPRWPS
jgi:enoyl-CoA hydratase/carnithine racemase